MATKKAANPTAAFDNKITKWFTTLVYAGLKDIEVTRGVYGTIFDHSLNQNYDSLVAAKPKDDSEEKGDKTKARFTVAVVFRQYLRIIYNRVIKDILEAGGSVDPETIDNEITDALASPLLKMSSKGVYNAMVGDTLAGHKSADQWFESSAKDKISEKVTDLVANATVVKEVVTIFKALAWHVAAAVYYNSDSCSLKLMTTVLITNGVADNIVDDLVSEIKIPPPAVRKPKAAPAETPAEKGDVAAPAAPADQAATQEDPLRDILGVI